MRIRSLEKYIKLLTKQDAVIESEIGNPEEPLLRKIYGEETIIDQVITDIASFASDAQEQIFYEFVQNAYDAEAHSLMFFANKDFLFVINDGKPFYTGDKDAKGKNKKGQLFEFLAKNKAHKWNDDSQMGQYGQGSKLLYKLIVEETDGKTEKYQLKAIKEDKKGPYLLSWYDSAQLDAFLYEHKEWEYQDPENAEKGLLLTKIIYTYYPVAPGENSNLFADKEVDRIRDAFQILKPESNKNLYRRGTALIIPLGKGKYERIADETNIQKVEDRLRGVVALIGGDPANSTGHIDRLFLLGKEIKPVQTHSEFVECEMDGDKFKYQFAFNGDFANDGCANLFKYLPIPESQFNLGFLIDCKDFEVDNSRQRIVDEGTTKRRLQPVFESLVKKLQAKLLHKDADFDEIYDAIISSQWKKNQENYIMQVFEHTLLKFVRENIRTKDRRYFPSGNLYDSNLRIDIPLQDLGITDKHWIDPKIKDRITDRLDIKIQPLALLHIVKEADEARLEKWIESLSAEDYEIVFNDLKKHLDTIKDVKFIRSNKKKLFSFQELADKNCPVFFATVSVTSDLYVSDLKIEYIPFAIPKLTDEILIDKITAQAKYFAASYSLKCVAVNLLNKVATNYNHKEKVLKIQLFSAKDGERKAFKELFAKRPQGTVLFDTFVVQDDIPPNTQTDWFMTKPREQWEWIKKNMNAIKYQQQWGQYAENNLRDLSSLNPIDWTKDDYISINLDKDGNPIEKQTVFLGSADKLNKQEYNHTVEFFSPNRTFIPYDYYKTLSKKPFKPETKLELDDLIDNNLDIPENIFLILTKIKSVNEWLRKYRIIWEQGKYNVSMLNGGENYYSKYGNDNIEKLLEQYCFYAIPKELQDQASNDFCIENNVQLAERILRKVDDVNSLLPVIEHLNTSVKKLYIDKLSDIELANINGDKDSLEWKILEFARSQVKNKIVFNGDEIPDSIKADKVKLEKSKWNPYNTFRLCPSIEDENDVIEKIWKHIPDKIFFKNYFIKETAMTAEDIFNDILDEELDLYQLQFCLDYAIIKEMDNCNFEFSDKLEDVLKMVLEKKLKGFDRYIELPDFKPEKQFNVLSDLLLSEEKLPQYIQTWIDSDNKANELLNKPVEDESSKYIRIREKFLKNLKYEKSDFREKTEKMDNTIRWLVEKELEIEQKSERFKTINTFTSSLPKDLDPCYLLKYTGDFTETGAKFKYEEYEENSPFLDKSDIRSIPFNDRQIKNIFKSKSIYYKEKKNHFSIQNHIEIEVQTRCNTKIGNKVEWNDKVYKKWKKEEAKPNVILLSEEGLSVEFSMHLEEQEIYKQTDEKSFFWDKDKDEIIIQSKQDRKSVKTKLDAFIEENTTCAPSILKLYSMLIDDIDNVTPELRDVVDKFDKKTIKAIVEKEDTIREALKDDMMVIPKEKFEELEPKIDAIYGYIGELIYKEYLVKSALTHKSSNKPEYDFTYEDAEHTIYIDVKTNAGSVKDGKAPFYIHKTQYPFIKTHPDYDYRIVRISLKDLSIYKQAKSVKNRYPGVDPRENDEAKKECQKVANEYWKETTSDDFLQKLHIYKICIPKEVKSDDVKKGRKHSWWKKDLIQIDKQ
jgi:hypothetical protein